MQLRSHGRWSIVHFLVTLPSFLLSCQKDDTRDICVGVPTLRTLNSSLLDLKQIVSYQEDV
jgi:hypothetical protein